ncbi:MAG: hypothetical protein IJ852_06595 [Alphaproteobacteria bacterium]|nr:hypothetical protein [Alphaproteobacteria bacterium]
MKKFNILIFLLMFTVFLSPGVAMADGAEVPAIFGKLADKATLIGNGLRQTGYIIAGLGLIFFSFMAIFNKISWKTLAYIMVSCFFLTLMWTIINIAATRGEIKDVAVQATGSGDMERITFPVGVPPVPTGTKSK